MAKHKPQSATAQAHNDIEADARNEAADASPNVADMLSAHEAWEIRRKLILTLANTLDDIAIEAALLRDSAKSVRLECKANGIDAKALTQLVSQRRAKTAKREKWEASRREIARAFGWDDGLQGTLFEPAEGLIPGQQREFMGADEDISPDRQAALDSGFFTREELGLPSAH